MRLGCYVCKKRLGSFQYKNIGLCSKHRRELAKKLKVKVSSVTLSDFVDALWYENEEEML